MDYQQEIDSLKLLLESERIMKKRYRAMLNRTQNDRDKYKAWAAILQDENDDLRSELDAK
jgi:hypothetical protein